MKEDKKLSILDYIFIIFFSIIMFCGFLFIADNIKLLIFEPEISEMEEILVCSDNNTFIIDGWLENVEKYPHCYFNYVGDKLCYICG